MKKIITSLALLAGLGLSAQVKVGDNVTTLAPGSIFEMESTNKGLMLPRVALTNTTAILPVLGTHAQAAGIVVYNTATAGDVKPGIYTNDGTKWIKLVNADATNSWNSYVAQSTSIQVGQSMIVTSGTTVTLPATASQGDRVRLVDATGGAGFSVSGSNVSPTTTFSPPVGGSALEYTYIGTQWFCTSF